jgi:cytochrome c oxidase subunit 2
LTKNKKKEPSSGQRRLGQGHNAFNEELQLRKNWMLPPMADHSPPLDYFLHSNGAAATPVMHPGGVFTAIVVAVCIIIAGLLLATLLRRRPAGNDNKLGREGEGMSWIYIGTGISTSILFAMGIYMLVVLNETSAPAQTPTLTVMVTGYQWWWQAGYGNFSVANEIHIPVGVPVLFKLQSADVIHTFWAPTLAGKTQLIPGFVNRQWIEADKPGVYSGQCAEFCGDQHAHMAFEIVAQNLPDYEAWESHQRGAALPTSDKNAVDGQTIFMNNCAACHAIRGTAADGVFAPDLTHLQSRHLIAAGLMTNTPKHLADWIAHAQELKPDSLMPDIALPPAEAAALAAYLSTLK